MADRKGQQLGNYRLVRLVGQGGFADVYQGEHVYLGTQAAIKVLHAQLVGSEVERFHQEARIIAHLEHPHIVGVLDFGIQEGTPFLVMTYAPNGTLRQRHPRGSRVPLMLVGSYIRQIASALQYAHERHLIHRDIKPENLLLGRNDEVLLSDFGIALVDQNSRLRGSQEMAGTVAYMAPEQIAGRPRLNSDQYSFGVIIYEWLCGMRPFEGSVIEIIVKHSTVPPPSLCEQVPELPADLEAVIMTALAKDPKQRFASMYAFAAAFEQACGVPASIALPVSPPIVLQREAGLSQEKASAEALMLPASPALVGYMQPSQDVALSNTEGGLELPKALSFLKGSSPEPPTVLERVLLSRRVLSRRRLVVGLAGLVGIGVAGSLVWAARSLSAPQSSPLARATPAVPLHPTAPSGPSSSITSTGAMYGFDPGHTYYNPHEKLLSPANVSRLAPAWKKPTGGAITSSPVVSNGVVYVGSEDSQLYAFDALTGNLLWSTPTLNRIRYSSPAVASGVAYIGSEDSYLYAFDVKTGKWLWRTSLGDRVDSSPSVVNGLVYVASYDHNLYALDTSGNIRWKYYLFYPIAASPAVLNGMVYIGLPDATVYAFDAATGTYMWSQPVGDAIDSSPAVVGDVVYVSSHDGKLYTFNAHRGDPLWNAPVGGQILSSPAVANGIVYIGSDDNKLHALEVGTGKVKWSALTGGKIDSSPCVANGVVFAGSDDGKLYAFDAKTGEPVWDVLTGGGIDSSPIVANGMVYVGSGDRNLYAFHLPTS